MNSGLSLMNLKMKFILLFAVFVLITCVDAAQFEEAPPLLWIKIEKPVSIGQQVRNYELRLTSFCDHLSDEFLDNRLPKGLHDWCSIKMDAKLEQLEDACSRTQEANQDVNHRISSKRNGLEKRVKIRPVVLLYPFIASTYNLGKISNSYKASLYKLATELPNPTKPSFTNVLYGALNELGKSIDDLNDAVLHNHFISATFLRNFNITYGDSSFDYSSVQWCTLDREKMMFKLQFRSEIISANVDVYQSDDFEMYQRNSTRCTIKYNGPEFIFLQKREKQFCKLENGQKSSLLFKNVIDFRDADCISRNLSKINEMFETVCHDDDLDDEQLIQVKHTDSRTLIYCERNQLNVHNLKFDCPDHVFSLAGNQSFYINDDVLHLHLPHNTETSFDIGNVKLLEDFDTDDMSLTNYSTKIEELKNEHEESPKGSTDLKTILYAIWQFVLKFIIRFVIFLAVFGVCVGVILLCIFIYALCTGQSFADLVHTVLNRLVGIGLRILELFSNTLRMMKTKNRDENGIVRVENNQDPPI